MYRLDRSILAQMLNTRCAVYAAFLFLVTLLAAGPVTAASGYRDFSFGSSISSPTADKTQSKLWWNDGTWWGCLYNSQAAAYHIYSLNTSTQTWTDTNVTIDNRTDAYMDVLWDGLHLYIVSGSLSGDALLIRYSYNATNHSYAPDAGFPITVRKGSAVSVTIAKDSLGRLWIVYAQKNQVWVRHSLTSDMVWGPAFALPTPRSNTLAWDDTCAIIAFQGTRIGVMWSSQIDRKFYFAAHSDTDSDQTWGPSEVVLPPAGADPTLPWADRHINLKTLNSDASGRVYAAVKTGFDDYPNIDSGLPLNVLNVRDPLGNWTPYTFGRVADHHTRAQILIDEDHSVVYVFASAPITGGIVYYKSAPLSNPQFPVGLGTPILQSSTNTLINDVTTTKQNINAVTGMAILASDNTSDNYLHNYLPMGNAISPLPVADAYVQDGSSANTNYGSVQTLLTKTANGTGVNRDSYFTFSLNGLSTALTQATLKIYGATSSGTLNASLYNVFDTSWLENTLTWNNRPSLGSSLGSATFTGSGYKWYQFDVTNYVQSQVANNQGKVGFALHSPVLSNGPTIQVNSREAAANNPQLLVSVPSLTISAPSSLVATSVSGYEVDLTWADNSNNEDGFKIERSTDGVTFAQIAMAGSNATGFADVGLAPSTTYTYRVRAFHTSTADSAYSNTASATTLLPPPAAPSALQATATPGTEIDLSWTSNSNNQDSFIVERSTDNINFIQVATPTATTYADLGLSPVTTYYYRVRSYNAGGGASAYSNVASATTSPVAPDAPANLTASSISTTEIDVAWTDNSSNETGFKIERSTDNVTFTPLATLPANTTAYANVGLAPGTTYYYRIYGYNGGGNSADSNVASATTVPLPPAAPTGLLAAVISATEIDVSWLSNSTNEDGFQVEQSTDNVTFTLVGTTAAKVTTLQNTGLTPLTTYYYRVRAFNSGGVSGYSNTARASTPTMVLAAPTNLAAVPVSTSEIDLTWTVNGNNQAGYLVEQSTDNTNFTQIGTVGPTASTFQSVGLVTSTTYYYRVRGYYGPSYSPYSSTASATTLPPVPTAPTGLTASPVSSSQIALSWTDNSNGAAGFRVEISTDGTTFNEIATTAPGVATYPSQQLAGSTTYFYRVRAYNAGGMSDYSNVASAQTPAPPVPPAAPTSLTAKAPSSTEVDLTWTDNSANENGFSIERSPDNITFTQLSTIAPNTTVYTDTGLTASTTYYYRVSAYNDGGASAYSNVVTITTPAQVTVIRLASADAYVRDGTYASSNFGSAKTLYVKTSSAISYNRTAFFKFDLSGFPKSVLSASVSFYAVLSAAPSMSSSIYSVPDTTWQENQITWNNQPALGSLLGSISVPSTSYSWFQANITGYVQSQLAGGSNVASVAAFKTSGTTGNLIQVNSREFGSNGPQLTVTY